MSKVKTGQIGQFSGKIGALVVCKWRGLLIGKDSPSKKTKPSTDDQLDQQQKFGKVSKVMSLFTPHIAVGWASTRNKTTPMNEALSYHVDKAVEDKYPNYHINFSKVLITRGRGVIDGGFRPVAKAAAEMKVEISWVTSNHTQRITQPTDQLTVIVLDENFRPGRVRPLYYEQIARREDLKAEITVHDFCKNHPVHVYMFFVSENGKLVSKSEYLGMVTPVDAVTQVTS